MLIAVLFTFMFQRRGYSLSPLEEHTQVETVTS